MIAVHVEGAVIIIEIVKFGRRQVAFVITEHTRTLLLFDRFTFAFKVPAISSIHQGVSHKPDRKAPVLLDFLSIPKYYTRKKVTYDSINGQNRRCI